MRLKTKEKELLRSLTPTRKKNISEVLKRLGKDYTLERIDCIVCIYRDLGNGYDIEIEGAQKKKRKFDIYVWKDGSIIEERLFRIDGVEQLKSELERITATYLQK